MLPKCVDDYISAENAVRVIEAFVGSLNIGELGFAKAAPNETGRPMYAPRDMLKLYLYGYLNRIRSSRRLEAETHRNLEAIWLMKQLMPDHKTIARFRHDNAGALKNVFHAFVRFCAEMGLYGKELIAVDGSKFKAVNSKSRNFSENNLSGLIAGLEKRVAAYMEQIDATDGAEPEPEEQHSAEEIREIIAKLEGKKGTLQKHLDELKETGETQKSLTDPDSRRMMISGKWDVGYNVQAAVDAKNKLIAEFEVTNRSNDANQLAMMSEKTGEILEVAGFTVVADAGYDDATEVAECLLKGISPHVAGSDYDICVPTDDAQSAENAVIESHENGRCVYITGRNLVVCPMGKILYPGWYAQSANKAFFHNAKACAACACRCTDNLEKRAGVTMNKADFSKEYGDDANLSFKQISVRADKELVKKRKTIVEHPFGTIKHSQSMRHVLVKGIQNVSGEFALAFLAYNFRRVINILGSQKLIQCLGAR